MFQTIVITQAKMDDALPQHNLPSKNAQTMKMYYHYTLLFTFSLFICNKSWFYILSILLILILNYVTHSFEVHAQSFLIESTSQMMQSSLLMSNNKIYSVFSYLSNLFFKRGKTSILYASHKFIHVKPKENRYTTYLKKETFRELHDRKEQPSYT